MADPIASKYVRPYQGAEELLHGKPRWCLWLVAVEPGDLDKSGVLRTRVNAVKHMREASRAASTRAYAHHHLFRQFGQRMNSSYLAIPSVVSETRRYFTAARCSPEVITSNLAFTAPDADGFLFSIISSSMFITWQRTVGGRLKSDLRFSSTIVWNNLPLPAVDDKTRAKIIKAGQGVLDARNLHPERSLAEHYNPLAMDPALVKAHNTLDAVVDRAFGAKRTCTSERERQEILFARYQELTGVITAPSPGRGSSSPAPMTAARIARTSEGV
jgi:hypothetical protein